MFCIECDILAIHQPSCFGSGITVPLQHAFPLQQHVGQCMMYSPQLFALQRELVFSVPLYAISSAAQQTLLTYTISPDYVSVILKLSLSWILEYLQIDSVPLCSIRSTVAQSCQDNTAALKEAPWPFEVSLELNNEHSTHLASNLHSITIQDGPGSVLAVFMQDGFVHMGMWPGTYHISYLIYIHVHMCAVQGCKHLQDCTNGLAHGNQHAIPAITAMTSDHTVALFLLAAPGTLTAYLPKNGSVDTWHGCIAAAQLAVQDKCKVLTHPPNASRLTSCHQMWSYLVPITNVSIWQNMVQVWLRTNKAILGGRGTLSYLINRIWPFIKGPFNIGFDQGMSDLLYAIKVATNMDVLLKFLRKNQVGGGYE